MRDHKLKKNIQWKANIFLDSDIICFFSALLMISCYVAEFKVILVPLSALPGVLIYLPSACTFPSFLP